MALLLIAALLAACDSVTDVIGQREPPTPTHRPLTTATPGGRLSVWLVTPTGQFAAPSTPLPGGGAGNPVGPNATATAVFATIQAATQAAAAPPPAPYFQADECPAPAAPAPPSRPDAFSDYSAVIGRYLSVGGSSTVLEATLRNWGAITERGGVVQHRQQGDQRAPGRCADGGDGAGIPAKCGDVVVRPLQGQHDVVQAGVRHAAAVQPGKVEKTKGAQTVVDGDDHDVPVPGESRAVKDRGRSRAAHVSAPVHVKEHRHAAVRGHVPPDVQREAIRAAPPGQEAGLRGHG